MKNTASQSIAALNDQFRQGGINSKIPGRMFATEGVSALPIEEQIFVWQRVMVDVNYLDRSATTIVAGGSGE